jgi:DNA primase
MVLPLNVEELLISKGIEYIPKGGDYEVRCLSPQHEDRHPSLRIDRITGIFGCFSCGFKGNLFTLYGERVNFLQQKRDLLVKKIRNKVAESIGLTFPADSNAYEGDWRGIKPETYIKFEAFLSLQPDFKERVCFPVRDVSGRIAVFNGRHMSGGTPKYKISPPGAKIPLYPKVDPIHGSVILVEGIFDMINLHDKGLTNAVCCHGTRNISEDKLSMLKIQGVEEVFVFFDGDEPGQTAAEEAINMCEALGLLTQNVQWKGKDPGELSQAQVDSIKEQLYA